MKRKQELNFICVGDVLIDMIPTGANAYEMHFGGAPANFAVSVSALGSTAGLVSRVGNDPCGKFLLDYLIRKNVDTSHLVVCQKERTSLAFVDKEGDFVFYRNADAQLSIGDIDPLYIASARFLHVSGFPLSLSKPAAAIMEAVKIAKNKGNKVSFSVNYRRDAFPDAKKARKIFWELVKAADFVFASENEAKLLGQKDSLSKNIKVILSEKKEPDVLLVVTLGERGALLSDGKELRRIKPYKVAAGSAVGAGDAFAAGFMHSINKGRNIEESSKFASALAALAVTRRGATSAVPSEKEVFKFIQKRKR